MSMGQGEFGDGAFGGVAALGLHVVPGSKTTTALTLGWTPPAGQYGVRLWRNGSPTSSSYEVGKNTWRTAYRAGDVFRIEVFSKIAEGTLTV